MLLIHQTGSVRVGEVVRSVAINMIVLVKAFLFAILTLVLL